MKATAAAQGLVNSVAAIGLQQLFARLIPFFLHTAANNKLTPEDASLGSVTFGLLQAIVYSLGREGFRRGCLRASSEGAALRSAIVLLPFWALTTTAVCWAFTFAHPLDVEGKPQAGYQRALLNYWLALLLEGLVEPLFILGTFRFDNWLEVASEVVGRVAGAAAFAATVLIPQVHAPAAVAYSRGQLAFTFVMATFYFTHAAVRAPQLLAAYRAAAPPEATPASGEAADRVVRFVAAAFGASPQVLSTSLVFAWQAVQKMLLQDAGKFVMASYGSHVAGVYGEVQNLGSLVVRIVFWPIESAAFRTFSRFQSAPDAAAASEGKHAGANEQPPQLPQPSAKVAEEAGKRHVAPGLRLLSVLTRLVVLVALLACTFGPNYAFSAIHVLLSSTWSSTEAPQVLSAYCFYLVFMAINGVTEAYVHATLSTKDLRLSNAFMVAATFSHVGLLWLGSAWGGGCLLLVAADSINMALRIAFSAWCICRQHPAEERPNGAAWLPSGQSVALLVACFACTVASKDLMMRDLGSDARLLPRLPSSMLRHVAVGCTALLVVLLGLYRTERALIREARALLRPHSD